MYINLTYSQCYTDILKLESVKDAQSKWWNHCPVWTTVSLQCLGSFGSYSCGFRQHLAVSKFQQPHCLD